MSPLSPLDTCSSCLRPKAVSTCEICHEPLCKNCLQFLEESTFSFYETIPEPLSHTYYCPTCFSKEVEPALETYNEIKERAKGLFFFFTSQRKPIPLIKKFKESVKVESCTDRNETILRLAFQAAEQGYNAVIEAEVVAKKIRNEGYQKSQWSGVGFPAQVNAAKLDFSDKWKND